MQNDGIRCDAEYRGMCYALNENVCKASAIVVTESSCFTFVRRYLSRGIIITGTYPGRKVRMTGNHRTEVPVTAEQFADEIREQLKYTQNAHRRAGFPLLTCMSPRQSRAQPPRRLLVQDPGRHRQRQHQGRRLATCPPSFLDGQAAGERTAERWPDRPVLDKAVEPLALRSRRTSWTLNTSRASATVAFGRLAACFIDFASLGVPAFGYGIQYKHGIFKQKSDENGEVETPDYWLANEELRGSHRLQP